MGCGQGRLHVGGVFLLILRFHNIYWYAATAGHLDNRCMIFLFGLPV